jgi:hypothetical protein
VISSNLIADGIFHSCRLLPYSVGPIKKSGPFRRVFPMPPAGACSPAKIKSSIEMKNAPRGYITQFIFTSCGVLVNDR